MLKTTKKQEETLALISLIESEFGARWFIRQELPHTTMHTLNALLHRKLLQTKTFNGIQYFKKC
uniref:Uncharacterized protein n=1 Tax=viral metagenome TaxID=1070528 RepID=A0A6M3MFP3_9ZZZZ